MKFEQIFSLRCQTEQAESFGSPQTFLRMTFFSPSLLDTNVDLQDHRAATILRIAHYYDNPCGLRIGGAGRDRTDDILLAKQALSQLSYGP